MPAYRSSAEADIRGPVVDRLREVIPGCRIIHEINAASFGNRIDVLAVGHATMAAVEIKSERDKLDRLPAQIKAMRGVSNLVFAALHERFLSVSHGGFYVPSEAQGAVTWVWPIFDRVGHIQCGTEWHGVDRWRKSMKCLPHGALAMLWREELQSICRDMGVKRAGSLTMDEAMDAIRWNATGEEITRLICGTLRRRVCVESDPPC